MNQNAHAEAITTRFKELFEQSGESLSQEHFDELTLLIEAGLDAAIIEKMEQVANQLTDLSHNIRHNAEYSTPE